MATREPNTEAPARVGGRRPESLDETKHATKTTEFWGFVALLVALLIAGAVLDDLDPDRVWRYVTILAVGYMVSRGIAKSQRGQGRGRETKDSLQTTEFIVFVAALVGLLIAGAVSDGEADGEGNLEGARVWLYAVILGVGYMVSRGLAKSGPGARSDDRGDGGGGPTVTERAKAASDAFSEREGGSTSRGPGGSRGPGAP